MSPTKRHRLPLRNIARNIAQRIGSPNACLLNLVLLYQRAFRLRSSGNITTNRMTATIAVSRKFISTSLTGNFDSRAAKCPAQKGYTWAFT